MRTIHTDAGKTAALAVFAALSGWWCTSCTVETSGGPTGDDAARAGEQAYTAGNPLIDAYYECDLPFPPTGVTYSDVSVSQDADGAYFYVARSDRRIEQYSHSPYSCPLVRGLDGLGEHIDWVANWNSWLVADNVMHKIKRLNSFWPLDLPTIGDFPAGVTGVMGVAGYLVSTNPTTVRIYIAVADQSGLFPWFRRGTYREGTSNILWSSQQVQGYAYRKAFTGVADPQLGFILYETVSYYTSFFERWLPFDPSKPLVTENLAPYTEHAYTHIAGYDDRLAPNGLTYQYNQQVFWGLDDSVDNSGNHRWVMAQIAKSNLRF
jgi:hypothetical protein